MKMNFIFWIYATTTILSMCNGFPSKVKQSGNSLKLNVRARLKPNAPKSRTSAARISAYVLAKTPKKSGQAKPETFLEGNRQSSPKRRRLEARISAYILKNKSGKRGHAQPKNKFPKSMSAHVKLHTRQHKPKQHKRLTTYAWPITARIGAHMKVSQKTARAPFQRLISANKPSHIQHSKRKQRPSHSTATQQTPHNIKIHHTIIVNKTTNVLPSNRRQDPTMHRLRNGLPITAMNKWPGNRHTGNSHSHGGISGLNEMNPLNGGSNANIYHTSWSQWFHRNPSNGGIQDNGELLNLLNSYRNHHQHQMGSQFSPKQSNTASTMNGPPTSSQTSKHASKITIFPSHPSIKQITIQGQRPVIIATGQKKVHFKINPNGSAISISSNSRTSSPHRTSIPPEELPEREI